MKRATLIGKKAGGAARANLWAMVCLAGLVVLASFADADVQWLTWDDSREGTAPEVRVVESDANSTTFEVMIHGFFMEEIVGQVGEETVEFSRIFLPRDSMSNYGTTVGVGRAELPVIRRTIAVLSDADKVVVEPDEIDEEAVTTLEGITVYPFQELSSDAYPQFEFSFLDKFYTSNISYPINYEDSSTRTYDMEAFHQLPVARVEMYPFVYVPGERVLRVYRHFTVRADHEGEAHLMPPPSTPLYEQMYGTLLANYDQLSRYFPAASTSRNGSYLILVPDEFYMNVLPLASWKREKGLSVSILRVPTQVENSAEAIKAAIESFYYDRSPSGDVFVLLAGDVETVATASCEAYEWNLLRNDSSSDIQYARVSGDDPIPDLLVGRLPADAAADVDRMIGKILEYETQPGDGDRDWLGKVLLVAHKQDYPGKHTACKERIRSYSYSYAAPTFDTAYGGAGAGNADVRDAVLGGRGVVGYRGLGGSDCWWAWGTAGQSWCISPDIVNLSNSGRTPIILSVAGLTAHIKSSDCLGEEFVKHWNGGAVAYYGASADSGIAANDALDKNLFRAAFDKKIHFLGAVTNWAQIRTMEDLGGSGAFSAENNAAIYTLLGDPEMSIRTRSPLVFATVEYPNWVEAGPQTVSVIVKNANGGPIRDALVTLQKYKGTSVSVDVAASGYTNDKGAAEFVIAPAIRGGLSVTVVKQDYIPFRGGIALQVVHCERDPETGAFSFSWQIQNEKNYAVYVSDKIGQGEDWDLFGISPTKEGLTMTLSDPAAGGAGSRFYKVKEQ